MAQEQKKLRTLLSEKEAMPHLKRPGSSFGRATEPCNVNRKRVDAAGRFASSAAPSVRSGASSSSSSSSGSGGGGASATELIRPRSSAAGAGQCGEFFKGARRLSAPAPFNYVAVSKGGSMSSSLALS